MITAKELKELFKKKYASDFEIEKEKMIKLLETEITTLIKDSADRGYRCAYLEFAEEPIKERIAPTERNAKFIKQYLKKHGYKVQIYFKDDLFSIVKTIKITW